MFGNLLNNLPPGTHDQEVFESLIKDSTVRIERIVSSGQASPENFWYDQPEHEFVLVLQGSASIQFSDGTASELQPGSWLQIPAHRKHRVHATSTTTQTVWLAVFWKD